MRRHRPYKRVLIPRARELRRDMTPAERKLWFEFLRSHPVRVLRQRTIESFIVDFYCASRKLVIEVDGDSHFTPEGLAHDLERSRILEGSGCSIVRFSNTEVMSGFEGVCERLNALLESSA
jgi:very-short-patch-repair endonuclease